MKFTQLTNEFCGAKNAGYEYDYPTPRETDKSVIKSLWDRCGETAVNNAFDALADNEGDLYLGEDGNYYAVTFDHTVSPAVPIAWMKLRKAN